MPRYWYYSALFSRLGTLSEQYTQNKDLVVGKDGLARPAWVATDPLLRHYYDTEWGMPVRDERGVFERLSLEAFQAGLSWATILRKRPALRDAFAGFEPDAVARFTARDVERLLADGRIIRNRAKIEATVYFFFKLQFVKQPILISFFASDGCHVQRNGR